MPSAPGVSLWPPQRCGREVRHDPVAVGSRTALLAVASLAAVALMPGALFVPVGGARQIARRSWSLKVANNQASLQDGSLLRGSHVRDIPMSSLSVFPVISAVVLAGVLAVGRRGRAAAARKAFENELGVQAPLGYFDPLGFLTDGDFEEFYQYRHAEIKHGRVAMYATIGYIVPEYFKFPGYVSPTFDIRFEDVPNGIKALGVVPVEGWLQIIAFCGYFEMVVNTPLHPSEPGNYYKGRLGIFHVWWNQIGNTAYQMVDPEKRRNSFNAEIANGRLAMVAIIGMFAQNGVTGTTGPAMWFPSS